MVGERFGFQIGGGLDYNFLRSMGAYAGMSEIWGLETFSLASAQTARRTSPFGSAAAFFQMDKMQVLTANVSVRGQAFSRQPSVSVMTGYRAAF